MRAAAPGARIVAFGPHVDTEGLAQARRDGADAVLPRSRFFRTRPRRSGRLSSARLRAMADYPMDTAVTDHLLATTRAVRKRLDLDRAGRAAR